MLNKVFTSSKKQTDTEGFNYVADDFNAEIGAPISPLLKKFNPLIEDIKATLKEDLVAVRICTAFLLLSSSMLFYALK